MTPEALKAAALKAGFDAARVASLADENWPAAARLDAYIAEGRHASMRWMAEHHARRRHPRSLWPQARSALVVAMNYGPDHNPMESLKQTSTGNISVYARGRDYHDVMKGKLKQLAQQFSATTRADVKIFTDTAPLMEKPLAELAGLGWQGKHTNLVSRDLGSWFFLGVMLTTADLVPDKPHDDHCGSCSACLDICPTRAFPAPYELDARRCISYLTIEHKGPIPREFRAHLGNRIYGCDDCLAVCPWNKFAVQAREAALQAREELNAPPLADLARLDDAAFRHLFRASPVKRTGRDRFVRNVCLAIGNSGDAALVPVLIERLDDASPDVRGAAIWALLRLDHARFRDEKHRRRASEDDASAQAEWDQVTMSGWEDDPHDLFMPDEARAAPAGASAPPSPARAKPPLWRRLMFLLLKILVGLVLLFHVYALWMRFLPAPVTALMVQRSLQGETVRRDWTSLDNISPHLVRAVIAGEDANFCTHGGIDFDAVKKAAEHNRQKGKRRRGGSTVTQQTAKNVFFWNGGGMVRKAGEAWMALVIDRLWGKRRVMEVYLNVAEWGDGIFGAEAAAQARFGKSAKDLTRLEAARLAAVLPSPNKWSANKPGPYVRKRTGSLQARMKVVENEGYAACVLKDKAKPVRSPVAKGEPEPPEAVLPELPEAPAGSLPGDEAEMPLDNPLTEESEAALGVGPDAADDRLRPESPDAPAEPAEGLTEVGPADLRPALPETLPEEAAPAAER